MMTPDETRNSADADRPGLPQDEIDRKGDRIVREHFRRASGSWGMRYSSPLPKISDQDLILRRENVYRLLRAIIAVSPDGPRLRILDLGCGTGDVLDAVPRERLQVTGVDFLFDMLQRAATAHPGDAFVVADATELPVAHASQDVVICIGVLEYLRDPTAVLASIRTVLRPAGHLIVSFPNRRSPFRLLDRFESRCEHLLLNIFRALGARRADEDGPRYRHREWTVASARHLLAATGFEVDRILLNTFGLSGLTGTWRPNLAFSEWMSRRYFAESPVSTWLATTMVVHARPTGGNR
jgi:ubiquinone/menaquinone biosynthesis C-methylase UbiE